MIFEDLQRGDRVRVLKDLKTANRIMRAGQEGTVYMRWPYLLEIVPDGKKLPVGTHFRQHVEKI